MGIVFSFQILLKFTIAFTIANILLNTKTIKRRKIITKFQISVIFSILLVVGMFLQNTPFSCIPFLIFRINGFFLVFLRLLLFLLGFVLFFVSIFFHSSSFFGDLFEWTNIVTYEQILFNYLFKLLQLITFSLGYGIFSEFILCGFVVNFSDPFIDICCKTVKLSL